MALEFFKPQNFLFKPGQFVDLSIRGRQNKDLSLFTHTFSIASPPVANQIIVATRIRDTAFKCELSILPIGAEVRIKGPMGSFTLHNNPSRPAVFLAGGIGVVPFVSMLTHAALNKLQTPITLFYANRFLQDAAFMNTLRALEISNSNFRFVPTLTRMDIPHPGWKGEIGHFSPEMLSGHVSNLQDSICYVAGPPSMVSAAQKVLNAAGVHDDDIRTEEFPGY